MTNLDAQGSLATVSDTLSPLPVYLVQGLSAIAILAVVSLITTTSVFVYLTLKLVVWYFRSGQRQGDGVSRTPNPFFVLVLNLLLADVHRAVGFALNGAWVSRDGIYVGTPTCFIQGLSLSTGILASSCFSSLIALHTYMAVVWRYKFPPWFATVAAMATWAYVYAMALVGVAVTQNGRDAGGYYVRAATWCWINVEYETLRLVLHYLWIFVCLVCTSVLYTLVFVSLRTRHVACPGPAADADAASKPGPRGLKTLLTGPDALPGEYESGGNYAGFLVYPVIYVVTTAPLALGRVAIMAGVHIPPGYLCVAGALIASSGFLDVVLWSVTRRELLYTGRVDVEDSGLASFTFMRTPNDGRFGNMVWVEGGRGHREEAVRDTPSVHEGGQLWLSRWLGASWSSWMARRLSGTTSQENLQSGPGPRRSSSGPRDMTIHMDTVTAVVYSASENDANKPTAADHAKTQ